MSTSSSIELHWLAEIVANRHTPQAVPQIFWPEIRRQAQMHGLAPMLLHIAKQASLDISAPEWETIIDIFHEAAAHYVLLKLAYTQIENALSHASIPMLWLKGIVLAQTIYPHPSLRPMMDLDVLIPFEQQEVALRIAQELGYSFNPNKNALFQPRDRISRSMGHHYALLGGPMNSIMLELHYRLVSRSDKVLSIDKMEWFWSQMQRINGITTLSSEAHLLYLCAHLQLQHGEQRFNLLHYLDLHNLITQTTLDWTIVTNQAAKLHWTYAVMRSLQITMQYFQTVLPEGLLEILAQQQSARESFKAMVRLQWREGATPDVLRSILPHLRWFDKARLLFRLIVPPQDYMRRAYNIPANHSIVKYYPYRWIKQAAKAMRFARKRLVDRISS